MPPRLKLFTYLFILFIFSASFYMRQVLRFFAQNFGRDFTTLCILLLFVLLIFVISRFYLKGQKLGLLFIGIFLLGLAFAASMQMPEERAHIVKFGFLGWLITSDLI